MTRRRACAVALSVIPRMMPIAVHGGGSRIDRRFEGVDSSPATAMFGFACHSMRYPHVIGRGRLGPEGPSVTSLVASPDAGLWAWPERVHEGPAGRSRRSMSERTLRSARRRALCLRDPCLRLSRRHGHFTTSRHRPIGMRPSRDVPGVRSGSAAAGHRADRKPLEPVLGYRTASRVDRAANAAPIASSITRRSTRARASQPERSPIATRLRRFTRAFRRQMDTRRFRSMSDAPLPGRFYRAGMTEGRSNRVRRRAHAHRASRVREWLPSDSTPWHAICRLQTTRPTSPRVCRTGQRPGVAALLAAARSVRRDLLGIGGWPSWHLSSSRRGGARQELTRSECWRPDAMSAWGHDRPLRMSASGASGAGTVR